MKRSIIGILCCLLRVYHRFLAPFQYCLYITFGLACGCRFQPTCSEYACQCFQKHRFWHACNLIFRRLLRCHPLCPGGYDPIP